ncbi:MAG: DUF488 family protein [Betaproteobacteria bacterium]|nr:DUF488 family protein [Betaproteobacteria bacterium]
MTARIVRLGTPRLRAEGLRIGTVRHPPRGVPKKQHASDNWYDLWLPILAPSAATVKLGQKANTDHAWSVFAKHYAKEMAAPECGRTLALLAALSHQADFSVGCYCVDESRCHRSILRQLLKQYGAKLR